ncbi:FG-GAP repeat domain-containing protein [Streptomyces sp. NPDC085466]|uniref:FG-GAP repeat domain-containing protein n=1 Tax=Streptomyces sp. NPDC085466 TaxID=3365725 RepID=UPI0037D360F9
MRTDPTSRRTVRLASAMVAAGLLMTAAPSAVAAGDDDGVMKLTAAEATELGDRMGVDVYGDRPSGTDVPPADASGTDPASADASGDGSTPTRDTSGTEATGAGDAADPAAPVTFTAKSTSEGVRGVGATVPAAGGGYFTVHSLGTIQLHKADGSTAWARTNASLYADWKVKNIRPWQVEPYPARVLMGYNAVSPFSPTSDHGYDTGDLTADGVPDLVFSAAVGSSPYRPFTSPGSTLSTGTFVTVLDGRTGRTLWSKLYAYASMVKIVDGTLLVADAPRLNDGGAPTSATATLGGIRFGYADGVLTPSSTWTYDTGESRPATWGGIAAVGGGEIAVSWNLRKGAGVASHGTTLVLDTADGSVRWTSGGDLYGRQLHLDAGRGRLVALEQPDTSDAVGYRIAAYDLASGERTTLDARDNALATALTIGNLTGTAGAEYAVGESTLTSSYLVNAATIRVLKGTDGTSVEWSHTTKRHPSNTGDGPSTWRIDIADGTLFASAQNDRDIWNAKNVSGRLYGSLTAFNAKGKVVWQHDGPDASPLSHQVHRSGGRTLVRVVDQSQNIHVYASGNGKEKQLTPLQGDLNHGATADLNGDGKPDLVAGGNSRGVWAWSGPSLVKGGEPKPLWRATVPGTVRSVATGDVNGDGRPEVVVAADTATVVLDGTTGNTLTTIDGGGTFVRSVTVADTNADGKAEILVPTDALRAYTARGNLLWSYTAPTDRTDVVFSDAVAADGRVHVQYTTEGALWDGEAVVGGVALDGATGEVEWNADPEAPARAVDGKLHGAVLDHGVFASSAIPYADGHAVVHTWIVLADPTVAGDLSTASPRVIVEIRDGRTGEVLHQDATGSPWSHGNFFIDGPGDPLYVISFGTFRGYAAGGEDTRSSVSASLRTAGFATGPGGRKLVIGGTEAGVAAYDPTQLTNGGVFQSGRGGATLMGGRDYLTADLDGNGVDDVVSLNHDDFGVNRAAEQLGGGVLSLDNAIHQLTTYTLS